MLRLRHRVFSVHPAVLRRAGVRGRRDPHAHEEHARGGPGLPGPLPAAAGAGVRAPAVAAAVQAAADGGRARPLLPAGPLLPGRGPPGRPPLGVHPARPGDVVRHRGGRVRGARVDVRRGVGGVPRRGDRPGRGPGSRTRSPCAASAPTSPTRGTGWSSWTCTDLFRGGELRMFAEAVEAGGQVKAFVAPGRGRLVPEGAGRPGARRRRPAARRAWCGWRSPARRSARRSLPAFRRTSVTGIRAPDRGRGRRPPADRGRPPDPGCAVALDGLRRLLAERLGLIPEGRWDFLWVTEFPMFEWSDEEGKWVGHPPPVHRAGSPTISTRPRRGPAPTTSS